MHCSAMLNVKKSVIVADEGEREEHKVRFSKKPGSGVVWCELEKLVVDELPGDCEMFDD